MTRRSALLTIAGCPVRYYMGDAPPALAIPGAGGALYEDRPDLVSVGDWTESLRLIGGVGEYGAVALELATAGPRATSSDPAWVLGRSGWQGASAWALLAASISGADTTITLDRSMGLAAGDLIHLGRETIRVGAVGGGGLTLTGCTRGVGRTVQVPHAVAASGGPFVTAPLVYLKGRLAWLEINDGAGWVEVLAAVVSSTPAVEGSKVTVALTPWPALLDGPLGSPAPVVGLTQGWHAFQAGRACHLEFAEVFVSAIVGISSSYAAGALTFPANSHAAWAHEAHFSPLLSDGHPRRGLLRRQGSASTDLATAYPAENVITVNGTGGWSAGGLDSVEQPGQAELFRVDVTSGAATDQILPWPQCLMAPLAARCQTGDHTADPGGWVDVSLYPATSRMGLRRTALNAPNPAEQYGYDVRVCVAFTARHDWRQDLGVQCADWASGQPKDGGNPREQLWCAVDLRPRGATAQTARYSVPLSDVGHTVEIGGIATAFYQRGEPYLLIDPAADGSPPVVMPATGYAYVVLEGPETRPDTPAGQGGETGAWLLEVEAVDEVELGGVGGQVAYRLTITDRSRWAVSPGGQAAGPLAVCDWPGGPRATVRQVVAVNNRRWPTYLREILTSPGPNSQYPVGLALPAPSVPIALEDWSIPPIRAVLEADDDAQDLLTGWLQGTGQALVLRRTAAGVQLALRDVGLEAPAALADWTLAEEQTALEAPSNEMDDRVVTHTTLKVDWSVGGESGQDVVVVDQGALGVAGESRGLTVQLRGVVLSSPSDAVQLALTIGARVSALSGYPRRLWRVRVPMSWALAVSLGDTVQITHRLLQGYGPQMGVSGITARVIEIRYAPMRALAELTLAYHGHQGAGWAPALLVEAALSPTQVQVATSEYSADDLAWWLVGDQVRCVPLGDTDGASVTTIQAIGANTVTTVAPHGLVAGDRLEPSTVPGANQGGLAFLDGGSAYS